MSDAKFIQSTAQIPRGIQTLVPGYLLLETLGSGGMGVVYKARHIKLNRTVAVKVLNAPETDTQHGRELKKRFLQEARTAAKLRHENLVGALDVGESRGHLYMVQEYVEGMSLQQIIASGGPVPELQALDIVRQVAEGLDHAWRKKVVHRDVKPGNILVTDKGEAKLCDLGLCRDIKRASRITATGMIVCTPAYASPEQVRGGSEELDCRTDIYSLGVSLYQAVTGTLPFVSDSPVELMAMQDGEPPEPPIDRNPNISEETNALILQMMEKDRDRRPRTPGALAKQIATILETLKARPAKPKVPLPPRKKRAPTVHPKPRVPTLWYILIGLGLAFAVVLLVVMAMSWGKGAT